MRREELPLPSAPAKDYPNQLFQCGRGPGHPACPLGPNSRGRCTAAETGCQPIRTWTATRRRVAWTVSLVILTALVFTLGTAIAPTAIRPGDLTTVHAQILSGASTSQHCAACHNNELTQGWFAAFATAHATEMTESMADRCLDCHHGEFASGTALLAHNLPLSVRQSITDSRTSSDDLVTLIGQTLRPTIDQENLQCSVCHHEHRGPDANLSAISNTRCQSCHVERFDSFVTDHPEFPVGFAGGGEPSDVDAKIHFDHVRHALIHYPASAEKNAVGDSFDCRSCHLDANRLNDSVVTTLPYETACASCHDAALRVATQEGPTLIALPMIPSSMAQQLPSWPTTAVGPMVEPGSPWTRAILDGGRVPLLAPDPVADAARLRQWTIDLAIDGQSELLRSLLQSGMEESDARVVAGSFPPTLMRDAVIAWWDQKKNEVSGATTGLDSSTAGWDDLSGDSLLRDDGAKETDPLLGGDWSDAPATDWKTKVVERIDPGKLQTLGGWYRDDVTLRVTYRGAGHADPVIAAVARWVVGLSDTDPIRAELLSMPSIQSCLECHHLSASVGEVDAGQSWKAARPKTLIDSMNHFSHRPHLSVAVLADCQTCHRLQTIAATPDAVSKIEFSVLQKQTCANCHTASAAGDDCTMCHRYHVGE